MTEKKTTSENDFILYAIAVCEVNVYEKSEIIVP